jgi:hypothetical protein
MGSKVEENGFGAWLGHMRRGEFGRAWEISDAVLRSRAGKPCDHLPRHQQYFWDGTPLEGRRVLVRCYHGLGDTIQFIRYAPLVKTVAAELTVLAQPELIPLLRTVPGIDRLLPLTDAAVTEHDLEVEVMELPHVFRTTVQTIPSKVPYLHADPLPLARDGQLQVGLVWEAGDWDGRRSVPFAQLAPLASVPGVAICILQRDAPLAGWRAGAGVLVGGYSSLVDARIMRSLDLVITVDTMTAHLAGALGVPVWTLLCADADWRWMEGRDDSPWYPTMRLFRQERQGEWGPVVARVAADLVKLSAGRIG